MQNDPFNTERSSWCKRILLVQKDPHTAKGSSWCKRILLVQKDPHSSKGSSYYKRILLIHKGNFSTKGSSQIHYKLEIFWPFVSMIIWLPPVRRLSSCIGRNTESGAAGCRGAKCRDSSADTVRPVPTCPCTRATSWSTWNGSTSQKTRSAAPSVEGVTRPSRNWSVTPLFRTRSLRSQRPNPSPNPSDRSGVAIFSFHRRIMLYVVSAMRVHFSLWISFYGSSDHRLWMFISDIPTVLLREHLLLMSD